MAYFKGVMMSNGPAIEIGEDSKRADFDMASIKVITPFFVTGYANTSDLTPRESYLISSEPLIFLALLL